mmetsp:Transcript_13736/g.51255  ORF Transcript_13736/g.51255 Transcript_13736/m.51255 type:complete len:221 (-) Transcript_13736:5136-5798(-)
MTKWSNCSSTCPKEAWQRDASGCSSTPARPEMWISAISAEAYRSAAKEPAVRRFDGSLIFSARLSTSTSVSGPCSPPRRWWRYSGPTRMITGRRFGGCGRRMPTTMRTATICSTSCGAPACSSCSQTLAKQREKRSPTSFERWLRRMRSKASTQPDGLPPCRMRLTAGSSPSRPLQVRGARRRDKPVRRMGAARTAESKTRESLGKTSKTGAPGISRRKS